MDRTIQKLWRDGGLSRAVGVHARHSVFAAVRLMNENHAGSVLVFDGPTLVGIFTERDVLARVIEEGLSPTHTCVAQVMSAQPSTIGIEATLGRAYAAMIDHGVSHLPLTDHGAVVGVISRRDIMDAVVRDLRDENRDLHSYISGPLASSYGNF